MIMTTVFNLTIDINTKPIQPFYIPLPDSRPTLEDLSWDDVVNVVHTEMMSLNGNPVRIELVDDDTLHFTDATYEYPLKPIKNVTTFTVLKNPADFYTDIIIVHKKRDTSIVAYTFTPEGKFYKMCSEHTGEESIQLSVGDFFFTPDFHAHVPVFFGNPDWGFIFNTTTQTFHAVTL